MPEGTGIHPHRVCRKIDLHNPAAASKKLAYAYITTDASVLIADSLPVYRMSAGRSMAYNTVIELNSAAGPRPAK